MGLAAIRWLWLFVLIAFVGYTIYVSMKEKFFKSLKKALAMQWGRQVVIDLYIGLLLFHFFVYFIEKSLLKTIAWLIPTLIFGNIVPLIYVVTRFDVIMTRLG